MSMYIPPSLPNDRQSDGYNPTHDGCTYRGCGSQETSTVDGLHGRRCEQHPPRFDAAQAVELMALDPGAALDYLRGRESA